MKKYIVLVVVACLGAIIALVVYDAVKDNKSSGGVVDTVIYKQELPVQQTDYTPVAAVTGPDFRMAAEMSVNAVVHIRTTFVSKSRVYDDFFGQLYEFFEGRPYQGQSRAFVGYGSGVIISNDGYIVTNNHVVQGSSGIEVTLNDKRKLTASLIGNDPTTDLALIKVDGDDLPFLQYGNSDNLQIGEWVLAVGNPFNLTSTVTAGIVSAKARNINILGSASAIESYIQTDAAVNRGNSGGALVNTKGELVGINAAIASNSGSYEGYSFAIPVNLASKVVDDFMQFGEIQRAYIGVRIGEVDEETANENDLDRIGGVLIASVSENGGADQAGLRSGDIIMNIDGYEINSVSELLEVVGQHRPGDKVIIDIVRNGDKRQFYVELKNERGTTDLVASNEEFTNNELGVVLKKVTIDKDNYSEGLKVTQINEGTLKLGGVREGFVITSVNGIRVRSQPELENVLQNNSESTIRLEGIYPNGMKVIYSFER